MGVPSSQRFLLQRACRGAKLMSSWLPVRGLENEARVITDVWLKVRALKNVVTRHFKLLEEAVKYGVKTERVYFLPQLTLLLTEAIKAAFNCENSVAVPPNGVYAGFASGQIADVEELFDMARKCYKEYSTDPHALVTDAIRSTSGFCDAPLLSPGESRLPPASKSLCLQLQITPPLHQQGKVVMDQACHANGIFVGEHRD